MNATRTRRRADWTKRIDRNALLTAIGQKGQKMPRSFAGTFTNVTIVSRYPTLYPTLTGLTIIVKAGPPAGPHKSSAHRTFLRCERCNAEIPTGRYHQHYGSAICQPGS